MKKILFDLSSAQPQGTVKVNGGGEYATTIFSNLINFNKEFEIIGLLNKKNGENDFINNIFLEFNIRTEYFDDIHEIPIIAKVNKVELIIFPVCYSIYGNIEFDQKLKIINVIHDLSGLSQLKLLNQKGRFHFNTYKDIIRMILFELRKKKMINMEVSNHKKLFNLTANQMIFTDSYYSKYAMRYFLNQSCDNVQVLYPPSKIIKQIEIDENFVLDKYGVKKEEYFLLVSGDRWAKNNERAIRAFDILFNDSNYTEKLMDMNILVLGVNSTYKVHYKNITSNQDKFYYSEYVDSEELEILYKNAHLLVYPSLVEGFGYPPIEAMKYNTISACSTATSIPEICKDSSIYFNPYDIEDMIIKFLQSFDLDYISGLKERTKVIHSEITIKQSHDLKKLIDEIIKFTKQ